MSQTKDPQKKGTKHYRDRKLKVVRAFGREPRPCLPLKGHWLAQVGFQIGAHVHVKVEWQRLTITVIEEGGANTENPESHKLVKN